MKIRTPRSLTIKLTILLAMIVMLITSGRLMNRSVAQYIGSSYCADDVYNYCLSQGRPVDSSCQCDMTACAGFPESDCTEVGQYLDTSRCICVSNPSYMGYCDTDPYAYGCPRSFDTVFGDKMRLFGCTINGGECPPSFGGGDGDICSYEAFAWCNLKGGSWDSQDCACSGVVNSDDTNATDCAAHQGTWTGSVCKNPKGACGDAGGSWNETYSLCVNPDGYYDASQCGATSDSLSSCIAQNKRWNPYICKCS